MNRSCYVCMSRSRIVFLLVTSVSFTAVLIVRLPQAFPPTNNVIATLSPT